MENNLAIIRKSMGINQEQVANVFKVSRPTISNWERGVSDPNLAELIMLANMYGCTIDHILKRNPDYKDVDKIEDVFTYVSNHYNINEMKRLIDLTELYIKVAEKHERRSKKDQ